MLLFEPSFVSKSPDFYHRNLVFSLFFDMVKENTAYVTYDRCIILLAIQILSIYVVDAVKCVSRTSTRIQTENKLNI